MIEVFANDRQALCRRIYPTNPEKSLGVRIIGEIPEHLESYRMFPANPY